MLRVLLKLALAAAAVAAVWAFVPMGGRTMADRWHRAHSPADFVERAWAEVSAEPRTPARSPTPARPAPRAQARAAVPTPRPTEGHTESDRQQLDRIVSDHLDE
jgi:hypothetical protein